MDLTLAIEAAARAYWASIVVDDFEQFAFDDLDAVKRDALLADARLMVEAAAPLIEAAVREQVAEEIEAYHEKLTRGWMDLVVTSDPETIHTLNGLASAIRVVRGDV